MYFLNAAIAGMRRRYVASILCIFGGAALLTAMAGISLWSYWLGWEKQNVKINRTAAIFVDTPDNSVVEEVLTQVMQVPGVDSARIVSNEEFTSFLKQHFPDLGDSINELGEDVIPRTLELSLSPSMDSFSRQNTLTNIRKLKNVARVDDGTDRLSKAFASLNWLSYGGLILAGGLWLVLLIVCLGHYQSIFYTDLQEIQLIRSFGATKFSIFLPWLLEAALQSLLTGLICIAILAAGRSYLSEMYNQFFGALGYEPFSINLGSFSLVVLGVFFLAFLAHTMGGLFALFRGKIA